MLKDFDAVTAADCANIKVTSNFHSHNYLCGHAGGTVCDYVKEAVEHGFKYIGISDHCAPPVGTSEPYVTPDTLGELYLPQFEEAERLYGGRIKIFRGAEIEYFSGHDDYYERLLSELDYLVLGQHEYISDGARKNSFCDGVDEKNIVAYFDNVNRGLRSGYFALLAHPDLIFYTRHAVNERIAAAFDATVRTAVECGVALELNANGIRWHGFKYPTELLVSLCKKYNAKVAVSSDCHSPQSLCDEYMQRLYAYAVKHNLNVVDTIL